MGSENYLTVKQLANKYEAFSEASLRYWIFHSTSNNLDKAIRRVGKKILIAENAFLSWIENQGGKNV